MYTDLARTLLQLVEAVLPPVEGLIVTEAEIELPLEVATGLRDGKLVFLARAPHSRWSSGFLPPVHRGRLKLALEEG
jgi:hypothetical protein